MTELKTLKNFEREPISFSVGMGYNPRSIKLGIQKERVRIIEDLKQEAIKWVKELEKPYPIQLKVLRQIFPEIKITEKYATISNEYYMTIPLNEIGYFFKRLLTHIFNLTEEDLQ
jgi:hypothetical protein